MAVVDPQRGAAAAQETRRSAPRGEPSRADNEMRARYNAQRLPSDMEIWIIFI